MRTGRMSKSGPSGRAAGQGVRYGQLTPLMVKFPGLVGRLRKLDLQRLVWLGDFAIDLVPASDESFAKAGEIGRIVHAVNAMPAAAARRFATMI